MYHKTIRIQKLDFGFLVETEDRGIPSNRKTVACKNINEVKGLINYTLHQLEELKDGSGTVGGDVHGSDC